MFRQEVLNNRRVKWPEKALLLPGVPFWIITILCAIFLFSFLTFIMSGFYTCQINATGEVSAYPSAATVCAGVQGFITQQYFREGQTVRKMLPFILLILIKQQPAVWWVISNGVKYKTSYSVSPIWSYPLCVRISRRRSQPELLRYINLDSYKLIFFN